MLLGFDDYDPQAQALARKLDMAYAQIEVHRFPDGESRVTLPQKLPPHAVLCRSLDRPNDKLIELLLAAKTARQLGAARLSLVAPYLCYMRQDLAFHPGEAVSQKIIGEYLAGQFDDVITVDPHLHRIAELREAIPLANSIALSAAPLMSDFLRARNHPLLLGPDTESRQWVQGIAEVGGLDYGVCSKTRLGDREVKIRLPDIPLKAREVVLIDDVVSSGETTAISAEHCLAAGASRVDVLVTHALFAEGAEQRLRQAGVKRVWSTDSIPHATNAIALAGILSASVRALGGFG